MCEYYKRLDYLEHHGEKLALHSWIPKRIRSVLFYIHGKQSHAGWLFETGPSLAHREIAVFCLDRQGSGRSETKIGECGDLQNLLGSYLYALKQVKKVYPDKPLSLFGQSFGGSILAGLLCWDKFDIAVDAVIFCASGLGLQHSKNPNLDLKSINAKKYYPLGLADEDYTGNKKYLDFMQQDSLCLREISGQTIKTFYQLEELYLSRMNVFDNIPSYFIQPKQDPLVNYDIPTRIFHDLAGERGAILELPLQRHYVEFSPFRFHLYNWLSSPILIERYNDYGESANTSYFDSYATAV